MKWHVVLVLWSIISLVLILRESQAKSVKKRGVMDNFNDGLKVAGQMFGINTAADVANLVAKAFSNNNNSNRNKKPDLFSFIQSGLKLASFQTDSSTQEKDNTEPQEAKPSKETDQGVNFVNLNLISNMLRLVGFDANKLGALAINALIMIASALGNTIMGTTKSPNKINTPHEHEDALFNGNPAFSKERYNENAETGPEEKYNPDDHHQPRAINDDATTIEWFLKNAPHKMKRMLEEATHSDLGDKLIDMLTSYESKEGQASCLKMLVCKSSPFIWGMQRSIKERIEPTNNNEDATKTNNKENLRENQEPDFFNVNNFFTHMPTLEEYRQHGEKCEKLYSLYCKMD